MKSSPRLRERVKQLEGLRLAPYICPAGKWTVGWGHRLYPGDKVPGLMYVLKHWVGSISLPTAEDLLSSDLAIAEKGANDLVRVPLTQGRFDAVVDFILNAGRPAFAGSTLLHFLNSGQYGSASKQFERWVHDDEGKVLPGLVARRKWDEDTFNQAQGK